VRQLREAVKVYFEVNLRIFVKESENPIGSFGRSRHTGVNIARALINAEDSPAFRAFDLLILGDPCAPRGEGRQDHQRQEDSEIFFHFPSPFSLSAHIRIAYTKGLKKKMG
jgi:hypothetical protein